MTYIRKAKNIDELKQELSDLEVKREKTMEAIRKSGKSVPELHSDLRIIEVKIHNLKFKIKNGGNNSIPGIEPAPEYVINSNSQ